MESVVFTRSHTLPALLSLQHTTVSSLLALLQSNDSSIFGHLATLKVLYRAEYVNILPTTTGRLQSLFSHHSSHTDDLPSGPLSSLQLYYYSIFFQVNSTIWDLFIQHSYWPHRTDSFEIITRLKNDDNGGRNFAGDDTGSTVSNQSRAKQN